MYLKESVIWKERKYGSMLYDVKNSGKMKLNKLGTDIFIKRFVKYYSAEEIAQSIASQYKDISYKEVLQDVKSLLADIENSDFITPDRENRGFVNLLEVSPQIDYVNFEITKRCNLECKHCFVGGSKSVEELTTDEIVKLINELQMLKVMELVITGGEPLVREDLAEIIQLCTQKNIHVAVFTNGTLITESFLDAIKDCYVLLRFSVEGAKAETHDYIRGQGRFDKTIEAMKMCVEKGIDIGIASTIWKGNLHEYNDILRLGEELGVKEIEMSEVIPEGNAAYSKEMMLDERELEQLRINNFLSSIKSNIVRKGLGFDRVKEDAFGDESYEKEYSCNAGIKTCFINSRGDVYPCTLFSKFSEFNAGNIKEKPFADIWVKSASFDELRGLKVERLKACTQCECFKMCPGGCRAKAYGLSGSLEGPMEETFCNISRNILGKLERGELIHEK